MEINDGYSEVILQVQGLNGNVLVRNNGYVMNFTRSGATSSNACVHFGGLEAKTTPMALSKSQPIINLMGMIGRVNRVG